MAKQFDAILVLGCGIDDQGELIDDARISVETAANLYQQRLAPLLILSGDISYKATFRTPVSEAQAMKDYSISLGVPANKILVETESKDTLGNAYFTKTNLLGPLALHNIAILRGPNQSEERIRYLFGKVLGPNYAFSLIERPEDRPDEVERERKSLAVLKSWLDEIEDGDDRAIYALMRSIHPGYSADPAAAQDLQRLMDEA